MLDYCGEIQADDAVDPRKFFAPGPNERKQGRKALQLCRQIEATLAYVLGGEPLLADLQVVSVVPAPNSSRLLVTVWAEGGGSATTREAILERLIQHAGRLRSEIAAAITRRRAPTLTFNVVGEVG
jgi:ribosome-binding factor A